MQSQILSVDTEEHQYLPDANQLSVLASVILLAYALTPYINSMGQNYSFQLPGFFLSIRINLTSVVSILVAVLAVLGTDWILHSHPSVRTQRSFMVHWILPGLTAWVIGLPLYNLKVGLQWWGVIALGGGLLILILVAEFIVVDVSDSRYALATVGLTAMAFALYLMVAIAVRAAGLRLYLVLPMLVIPMALVVLRTLYLRLGGGLFLPWAIGIAFVVGQFAIGLHYLPLPPLTFGLVLLGPAYALTGLAGAIEEGRPWKTLWIEPVIMLVLLWGLAFIFSG